LPTADRDTGPSNVPSAIWGRVTADFLRAHRRPASEGARAEPSTGCPVDAHRRLGRGRVV